MNKTQADELIRKAKAAIVAAGVSDLVEVDEVEEALIRDSFSEVDGGTWVKSWVFVPKGRLKKNKP